MHGKKNNANRAKEGQDLRILKFISETAIEFQPHLHSPRAALTPYRRSEANYYFAPASGRLRTLVLNHCLTEQNVVPLEKFTCQTDVSIWSIVRAYCLRIAAYWQAPDNFINFLYSSIQQ